MSDDVERGAVRCEIDPVRRELRGVGRARIEQELPPDEPFRRARCVRDA